MAWGMNLCGMASIRSFEQAQAHWAQAEPWKNKHTSWRPLQDKRKEHVRLVRLDNEAGYECVLYSTAMVTYYADGDVKVIGDGRNASHSFAWRVSPNGVTPVRANGHMFWQVDTPEGERFYKDNKCLMLSHAPKNTWHLTNTPVRTTEKILDKERAAGVRKLLSHYDKWEKLTSRLLGFRPNVRNYRNHSIIKLLLDGPENIESFAELRPHLGPVAGFREAAYDIMGAYDEIVVPHDRLPRKKK